MTDTPQALRHSSLCRQLALLARGEVSATALATLYLDAIADENPERNAYLHIDRDGALAAAAASDQRRARGEPLGRLDGVPLAIKDNLDVAGLPTSAGLVGRRRALAERDAGCVARLRGAGAVILGKTSLDEAMLGTTGAHPTFGHVPHPQDSKLAAGGSSAGSAVAVAAGLASAAIGTDTLGSIRIPAAFCGVYGLRPTLGEISCAGAYPALPRLDAVGPIARSLDDLTVLLQVMGGYDPADPRSRRRRVPLALPDWEPDRLHVGVIADAPELGADADAIAAFERALESAAPALCHRQPVAMAGFEMARLRRAALLMMEAGIAGAPEGDLHGASPRLQGMLDFARCKTAVHYAQADRLLDGAVVATRRLFERLDVLLLPAVPQSPPLLGADEPPHLADFSAFASLAGCPALVLPQAGGYGLQLVGPPGSDLRLLELGEVLAALIGD